MSEEGFLGGCSGAEKSVRQSGKTEGVMVDVVSSDAPQVELGSEMEMFPLAVARTKQIQSESIRGTAPRGFEDKATEPDWDGLDVSTRGTKLRMEVPVRRPRRRANRRFMDVSGSSPVCAEACACCCLS